ncbi:DsbA family protein [Streptomyces melanogenes]|uniref:DsbA family protein n=1 Tax=Streptomyces melanogenes TaxID=67326 RepID=A0ABZ1XLM7_9ACTN|nr:DsbA family protein [Streptomyces melanogenes]
MSKPKGTPAPKSKSKPQPKSKSKKPFVIGAAVVAAAVVLGVASYQATSPGSGTKSAASSDAVEPPAGTFPELEKLARRDGKDPLAQGRADAPVVMIEYADFKCSYCGKFARDTEPALVKKYVDAGTLRIEWRNMPIFGAESEAAARAAWAAGQQGRFWQFHTAAYAKGSKEKGFGADRLRELAKEAGVADLDRFVRDADGDAAKAAVKKDQDEAYGLGATSTPSFVVNGRPLAGAQPLDTFAQAIDEAAAYKAARTAGPKGTGK